MGFMLNKMEVGLTPPIEYRAVTANEDVVLGEALALSAGKLTKCGATARPEYVAVGPKDDAGIAPVVRVQDYMEFETTLSAAPAEGVTLAEGTKVTLAADGLQVTATTTSGVAVITWLGGTAAGDPVRVRF